jgi:dihydroorotate dehydrogenase electron transfer subunit
MGSTPVAGELLAIGELAPGRIALEFRAPTLIAGLRPGHALHLVRPESGGYRVRRVAPVSRVDLLRGSVEVALQPRADGGQDALAGLRVGDVIEMIGPIGQPILINKATMRLLLIADGEGFAWVRALANAATSAGISVTMLQQAETAADLPPASLLPDVVEIVVATSDGSIGHRGTVADLLTEYVVWADQAVVAGAADIRAAATSAALRRRTADRTTASGKPARTRTAAAGDRAPWLQALLAHEIGCGIGACGGCTVATRAGQVRLCREGPAVDATGSASKGGA